MGYKWPKLIKVDFYQVPKDHPDVTDQDLNDAIDAGADSSETALNGMLGIGQHVKKGKDEETTDKQEEKKSEDEENKDDVKDQSDNDDEK